MSNTRKAKPATVAAPSAEELILNAELPKDSVPICLKADLVAEFERLERALEVAQSATSDSLAGTGAAAIAAQMEDLRDAMQAGIVDFELQAMGRLKWKAFIAEHPPRQGENGDIHPRDLMGVNTDTFLPQLIRRSTVSPVLSDEAWDLLLDEKLTDRQYDELTNAAWALNRGEVSVPFSRAASRILTSAAD